MTLNNSTCMDFHLLPSTGTGILFGIICTVPLLVIPLFQWVSCNGFGNTKKCMNGRQTSNDNSTNSSVPCNTQLIIDGCNGPIRLLEHFLPQSHTNNNPFISASSTCTTHAQQHRAISLLRVVNGENKGDRMDDVIPKLNQLLTAIAQNNNNSNNILNIGGGNAVIYFDGLGNKKKANHVWNVSPHISIKVTKIIDEADNVIVQNVIDNRNTNTYTDGEDKNNNANNKRHSSSVVVPIMCKSSDSSSDNNSNEQDEIPLVVSASNEQTQSNYSSLSSLAELLQEFSKPKQSQEQQKQEEHEIATSISQNYKSFYPTTIYTIRRNSEGPGRSRRILKPLQLLRPESVFCIFGCNIQHNNNNNTSLCQHHSLLHSSGIRDGVRLLPIESKLIESVEKQCLQQHKKLKSNDGVCSGGKPRNSGGVATIVVTDDVFLRQRIVNAGGFVMTFEQFWDLLIGVE